MVSPNARTVWSLRIAAVVYALYALAHYFGAMVLDLQADTPAKQALFDAMRSYKETIGGSTRSYWDFYNVLGLFVSCSLVAFAILCWQLASLTRVNPSAARPLTWTLFAISIPMTALTWTHLFLIPDIFATLTSLLLGVAAVTNAGPTRSH